jgi:hypothetical protein
MNSTDAEFLVKLTYAELYNEELKDLLTTAPSSATEGGLKIIEDPMLGPSIQNVTEAVFINASQVKALLVEGENRRHFGVTNMNAHSSRSHVLVRLSIESRKVASKSTTFSSVSTDPGIEEIGRGLKGQIKEIQIFNKVLNGNLQ